MKKIEKNVFVVIALLSIMGCHDSDGSRNMGSTIESAANSNFLAANEPDAAMPVGDARTSVEDQQMVTIVGTIGGSSEPFVDGLAAFTMVDPKVPFCAPDEGCPTPWDYCCTQDQVKNNIATVKIVDDTGGTISTDARELLGVKELSTVVVEGQAERDDQGNLTIAATQVFIRPSE